MVSERRGRRLEPAARYYRQEIEPIIEERSDFLDTREAPDAAANSIASGADFIPPPFPA